MGKRKAGRKEFNSFCVCLSHFLWVIHLLPREERLVDKRNFVPDIPTVVNTGVREGNSRSLSTCRVSGMSDAYRVELKELLCPIPPLFLQVVTTAVPFVSSSSSSTCLVIFHLACKIFAAS